MAFAISIYENTYAFFERGVAVLHVRVPDVAHNVFYRVGARSERASIVNKTDGISKEIEKVRLK